MTITNAKLMVFSENCLSFNVHLHRKFIEDGIRKKYIGDHR